MAFSPHPTRNTGLSGRSPIVVTKSLIDNISSSATSVSFDTNVDMSGSVVIGDSSTDAITISSGSITSISNVIWNLKNNSSEALAYKVGPQNYLTFNTTSIPKITIGVPLEANLTGDISGNAATVTNGVYTTSSVEALNDVTSAGSGEIITSAERTKLNGIETSATADQTATEIQTLYEGISDVERFSTTLKSKLDAIEASADVTDATNVSAAGAVMNSGDETIDGTKTFSSTISGSIDGNAATVTNGVYTTSSVEALNDVTSAGSGEIITSAERTKLNGIETSATADQTATEIQTLYEGISDVERFSTTLKSKLDAIEASADVTDATNVSAAGAVMNSGDETIDGTKTFSSTISGSIDGNAATATTTDRITIVTSAPSGASTSGTIRFNTSDNKLYVYTGSAWKSIELTT